MVLELFTVRCKSFTITTSERRINVRKWLNGGVQNYCEIRIKQIGAVEKGSNEITKDDNRFYLKKRKNTIAINIQAAGEVNQTFK